MNQQDHKSEEKEERRLESTAREVVHSRQGQYVPSF
jgi:hypothetical protein